MRTFDTFSTLEGTFDDDANFDYLDGIEEDYTESCNNADSNYRRFHAAMAAIGAGDHLDKVRSTSGAGYIGNFATYRAAILNCDERYIMRVCVCV